MRSKPSDLHECSDKILVLCCVHRFGFFLLIFYSLISFLLVGKFCCFLLFLSMDIISNLPILIFGMI